MQNYPYTTQWKYGKPILNPTQGKKDKGTPNPLQRNSINMAEDIPWCIICQSPHSPDYCTIAKQKISNHSMRKVKKKRIMKMWHATQ